MQGRILGQSLIPFLMDVCYEVHLEEDKVNAINIMTVYAIDFATFSVKLSGFDNDKQKNSAGNYMTDHQMGEDVLQMTSPTLIGHL